MERDARPFAPGPRDAKSSFGSMLEQIRCLMRRRRRRLLVGYGYRRVWWEEENGIHPQSKDARGQISPLLWAMVMRGVPPIF